MEETTSKANVTHAVFHTDVIFAEGKLINSTFDFHINLHEKLKVRPHLSGKHSEDYKAIEIPDHEFQNKSKLSNPTDV